MTLIRSVSHKLYRCPRCRGEIAVGTDHVVVRRSHPAREIRHTHWHRACVEDGLTLELRRLRRVPAAATDERPRGRGRGGRRSARGGRRQR